MPNPRKYQNVKNSSTARKEELAEGLQAPWLGVVSPSLRGIANTFSRDEKFKLPRMLEIGHRNPKGPVSWYLPVWRPEAHKDKTAWTATFVAGSKPSTNRPAKIQGNARYVTGIHHDAKKTLATSPPPTKPTSIHR